MSFNEVKTFLTNPDGSLNKQPVATPSMSLDAGMPRDQDGTREWKHGLCGCAADPVTFVVSWCLPCITYTKNKSRYEALHRTGQPAAEPEIVNRDTAIFCGVHAFTALGFVLTGWMRENTRARYNIKGDMLSDMLLSCFCHPCVLTQESLEIGEEEAALGGSKAGYN